MLCCKKLTFSAKHSNTGTNTPRQYLNWKITNSLSIYCLWVLLALTSLANKPSYRWYKVDTWLPIIFLPVRPSPYVKRSSCEQKCRNLFYRDRRPCHCHRRLRTVVRGTPDALWYRWQPRHLMKCYSGSVWRRFVCSKRCRVPRVFRDRWRNWSHRRDCRFWRSVAPDRRFPLAWSNRWVLRWWWSLERYIWGNK